MAFQTFPQIQAQINATVLDPAGTAPTEIIRIGDGFHIDVDWRLDGFGVLFVNPAFEWRVVARIDSIGAGFEGDLPVSPPAPPVPFVPVPGNVYTQSLNIPSLANVPRLVPGVYELVVLVSLFDPNNQLPMAGFFEAPEIQFIV